MFLNKIPIKTILSQYEFVCKHYFKIVMFYCLLYSFLVYSGAKIEYAYLFKIEQITILEIALFIIINSIYAFISQKMLNIIKGYYIIYPFTVFFIIPLIIGFYHILTYILSFL